MEHPTKVQLDLRLNFNCGCGFRSTDERESASHAIQTEHKLTIHGTLTKVELAQNKAVPR